MTGSVFFGTSSTLEKRFGYDSKLTGLIMVMDNFAEILVSIVLFSIQYSVVSTKYLKLTIKF